MNSIEHNPNISLTRREVASRINSKPMVDIVVTGGGIHGAAFANLAAAAGLTVTLLERHDYASATSSRSSKMAHGGLRYLEMFDFEQVYEGIRAREELFVQASHIVHPSRFLIPVDDGAWWFRLKLHLGLWMYDRFMTNPQRRHRWIARKNLDFEGFHSGRDDLMGCFQYTDGLMDDARLVIENILAARYRGADCLNYASVESISQKAERQSEVVWKDQVTGESHQITARLVVNCAGPWAPMIRESAAVGAPPLRALYSRGAHLLFQRPWNGPSLFLPLEGKARYYFVWPHPGGTMVGTTEGPTLDVESDPQITPQEVEEILERVKKDLPHTGLDRSNLYYGFCGIRTLPLREGGKEVARLSRKHIWQFERGLLSLVGGKFTTFAWTAFEGVKQACGYLGKPVPTKTPALALPGRIASEHTISEFRNRCAEFGIATQLCERAIARFGERVSELSSGLGDSVDGVSGKGGSGRGLNDAGGVLEGELDSALRFEQGHFLDDVFRRRLGLELLPDHGLGALETYRKKACEFVEPADVSQQIERYRASIRANYARIGVPLPEGLAEQEVAPTSGMITSQS